MRVKRHNNVSAYVARSLTQKGYTVEEEPNIRVESGRYKPDIIAKQGNQALVIDAQIVTDGVDLDLAHSTKVGKYDRDDLKRKIKDQFRVDGVLVTSVTLNWRGVWSKASCARLLQLGILRIKDLKVISTRVGVGSVGSFRLFNRSTVVRTGVG